MEKMYKIQDREAGNVIIECLTLAEAEKIIAEYEKEDKGNNNYTADFYEIEEMR